MSEIFVSKKKKLGIMLLEKNVDSSISTMCIIGLKGEFLLLSTLKHRIKTLVSSILFYKTIGKKGKYICIHLAGIK